MIVYKVYRAEEKEPFAKSCYLPTAKEKVIEDLSAKNKLVRISDTDKTIMVVTKRGHQKRLLVVAPEGDSDTIMYMNEEADEVYRIDREKLK